MNGFSQNDGNDLAVSEPFCMHEYVFRTLVFKTLVFHLQKRDYSVVLTGLSCQNKLIFKNILLGYN